MNAKKEREDQIFPTGGKQAPSLYAKLKEYCEGDAYPLHMPGHKRRLGQMADPFSFDITEIDGFDNLHHAEGILKEAQQRAAQLFGVKETFFLVNGSTAGILAAVSACLGNGFYRQGGAKDEKSVLLMARNCHRSVYHAAYLNRLQTEYVYPSVFSAQPLINGPVSAEDVRRALDQNPKIRAVLITSPTYEGVVSDIRGIADAAHAHGAVLIVDEAHGAHFGMHPYFPDSAAGQGADLVIQSLHKTLPALTQCALLHLCTDAVDVSRIRRMLAIYQTSSPSYVLMSSMDSCIALLREKRDPLFHAFVSRLRDFWEQASTLERIRVFHADDPSRVLVSGTGAGLSGRRICDILRSEYQLEMEMEAPGYALAIMSIADAQEGFDRLTGVLKELDRRCAGSAVMKETADSESAAEDKPDMLSDTPQIKKGELTIARAWDAQTAKLPLEQSAGQLCAEFVYLYPPGIPLLVPGERITAQMCAYLISLRRQGFALQGQDDYRMEDIKVVGNISEG